MIRTETATVVLTDIVGSTELASRLGFEGYEAVRRSHVEMLRLAASLHQGSEIKSTGDGLMFTYASVAEAVACMIRMQQMVDLVARRQGGEPRIRIGASCGEIARDGADIFGIAVVEAARLCAAALPSQILVSDLVRALTRGLGHKFVGAGELTLKGLPEPVLACTVEWSPRTGSDDAIALPPKIAPVPPFGLYGRAKEQAIFERCWEVSKQGQRQLFLLAGEPGIGKTRLAMEAGRSAHREGAIVLFGSCDEDIGYPYRPFVEALRYYVTNAPDDVLLQHVREHHGELLRIVPTLEDRVPNVPKPRTADAETERYLMFEAIAGLLAIASRQNPVLLILDDLQWARAPELLLLKHIVRSTMPLHLLIIGTYRDTDLSRTHPLTAVLADLHREIGIERIALRGLDEDGIVDFVVAEAGHDLDESQLALARAIHRDTEGSPLFVGEVLRNLLESGAAVRQGDRWKVSVDIQNLGIPQGVKEAIARRLSRLSVKTNKTLSLASVIGHEFDLVLLKQVAETSEEAILDVIDEAQSAALVAPIAGYLNHYLFTHVLVRTTLYDEFNPVRRALMHERIGVALEHLTDDKPDQRIDELARHWMAAAATNVVNANKAIGFARRAAELAMVGLAFEQAAKYCAQALSILEHHDPAAELLRCDLLIALGDAQRRAGDNGYRQTVAEAVQIARSLGDAKRFVLAVLGSARPEHPFANANLVDQGLIALYEEAIATLASEGEDILRAKLLAQLAGEMLYTPHRERRQELSREAVAIARRCGDKPVLAQALHIYASTINDPTTLNERLALTAEQLALADEFVSLETGWSAAYQRLGALLETGEIVGAKQMLVRMKELAGKLRQPFFTWATDHALAMISVMSGAASAEQEVSAAFQVGVVGGQPEAKMAYVSQLSVIRRDQGRHGELIESLKSFAESFPHLPVWRVILAGLYCETDQLDEARAQLNKLAAVDFKIPLDWTWPSTVISLAQICSDLGNRKFAALYYPQVQSVAGQVGVTGIGLVCYGSLAYPCGQLAACLNQWDEAEQYFDQALAMNSLIDARPYLVRTRRAYASMLLDRDAAGDCAGAAKLIEEAHTEANQLGMQREIVRLERLRRRIDTRVNPCRARGPRSLTTFH
jgi:class 3 adenylate cyclase/tetratricopeptide (TPR) repeat protein